MLLARPNNGGVRMFPGKVAEVDPFEADRKKVDLVATVNPVEAGCTVYFRVWDVDDPFDQNNAGMANVNLIDADTSGPDNRPVGAVDSGVGQWQAVTDAMGVARVTIEVSMQPGNNYRAAASLMLNGVDDVTVTQADADANMPPFGVTFSDMLTIWRKLHVETDTMVRPTFEQNTFPMLWQQPVSGPSPTQVTFRVIDATMGPFQTNSQQFLRGNVELTGPPGTVVVKVQQYDNIVNDLDSVIVNVTTQDGIGGLSGLAGLGGMISGTATFSDDDLQDRATFIGPLGTGHQWGCDEAFIDVPSQTLLAPDVSELSTRYAPGYIDPIVDDDASGVGSLSVFVRNQGFGVLDLRGRAFWNYAKDARDLPLSQAEFWTVMVVSGWQAEETQDADPDEEFSGTTLGINTHADGSVTAFSFLQGLGTAYTGLCAVFIAVTQPAGPHHETDFTPAEPARVAHEIGHTFGLSHGDGGNMTAIGAEQLGPFTPVSLNKLRNYVSPE